MNSLKFRAYVKWNQDLPLTIPPLSHLPLLPSLKLCKMMSTCLENLGIWSIESDEIKVVGARPSK